MTPNRPRSVAVRVSTTVGAHHRLTRLSARSCGVTRRDPSPCDEHLVVDGDSVGASVSNDLGALDARTGRLTQIETIGRVVGSVGHQHDVATRRDVLSRAVDDCRDILRAVDGFDDHQRVATGQLDARPIAAEGVDRCSPRCSAPLRQPNGRARERAPRRDGTIPSNSASSGVTRPILRNPPRSCAIVAPSVTGTRHFGPVQASFSTNASSWRRLRHS